MVNKEDINGNTPVKVVLQYLDQIIEDKYPRGELDVFAHGKYIGKLEILDLLRGLSGK